MLPKRTKNVGIEKKSEAGSRKPEVGLVLITSFKIQHPKSKIIQFNLIAGASVPAILITSVKSQSANNCLDVD